MASSEITSHAFLAQYPSNISLISYISAISVAVNCLTNAPLCGTKSTRPSLSNILNAVRIGVRLTPSRSHKVNSAKGSPGRNSIDIISALISSYTCSERSFFSAIIDSPPHFGRCFLAVLYTFTSRLLYILSICLQGQFGDYPAHSPHFSDSCTVCCTIQRLTQFDTILAVYPAVPQS